MLVRSPLAQLHTAPLPLQTAITVLRLLALSRQLLIPPPPPAQIVQVHPLHFQH